MVNHTGRIILTVFFGVMLHAFTAAQNFVPNPSFETLSECPSMVGQVQLAAPWRSTTASSPDLFNECGTGPATVPFNFVGFQQPHTGRGYVGLVHVYNDPMEYREYVTTQLTAPLTAGVYEVGFWVSLADFYPCGTTQFGAHFSAELPTAPAGFTEILELTPQFKPAVNFITDIAGWTLLSGCVLLPEGTEYITIGNFSSVDDSKLDADCFVPTNPNAGISYYYIDDVYLVKSSFESNILDLGGPVVACDEYIIDPGVTGTSITWSNGQHLPVITVTESGLYSVTISNGCSFVNGEIDVTIIEDSQVDLGPPSVDICDGDSYDIELDSDGFTYTWGDGSTDPEYTINATGEYFVTMDDGCHVSTDSIQVNVVIPPDPFTLTASGILCDGEEIIFDFDPSLGEFEWQDGSDDPYYIIDNPGEYALTISNLCGAESASVEVEGMESPEVYLGPDTIVLCNGAFHEIELYHDPATHTVLWLDTSTSFSYLITQPGHYGVTVTNACGSAEAVIDAVAQFTPQFNLGNDSLICGSTPLVLTPGAFPGSTYLWQDSTTNDSFTVTTPGVYEVTVTNVCGVGIDSIDLNFMASVLQPDLGPDANLCPGENLTLTVSDPGATFVWQDGSTGPSYVVTGPGQYIVTASNACNALSDTMQVSLNNNPPVVDLPAGITLCEGFTTVIDAGISGVTYLWNDMSTNESITVSTPGTYAVTVTNSCGSDFDSVTVIDGGPAPAVDLGSDLALCAGETQLLTPIASNVNSWLWGDGSTGSSIVISGSGQTTVMVGNNCGAAYDTLITTLLPAVPTFSLGNDTAVCENELVVLTINVPNVSIEWYDGTNGNSHTVSNAGEYFATISNSCGDYADTMQVTHLPAIPALDLGNDQSLCPGEVIVIAPGIPNVDYLWHDGTTGNTFTTTQGGTISLTISNECGSDTDQLEVVESTQGPDVDLGADIIGCEGEDVTIQSGISGVTYEWQDGSTQPSFTTNQSGEFMVTVTNSCGTDADTVLVDLSGLPPVVDLGSDLSLCDGEVVVLEANAPAGTTVLWQDGSGGQTYQVTQGGTYSVQLSNSCGDVSDEIVATYTSPPAAFSLGADESICDDESLVLEVVIQPGTQLLWSDGSNAPTLDVDGAGTFSATLSNECGEASDAITISVTPAPLPFDIGDDVTLCPGESLTLTAPVTTDNITWQDGSSSSTFIANAAQVYSLEISNACGTAYDEFALTYDIIEPVIAIDPAVQWCPGDTFSVNVTQPFPAMYSWSTGETTSSISIAAPGTYSVTVVTSCSDASGTIRVTEDNDCYPNTIFYTPNIFSPNGDGINDLFEVHFNSEAEILAMSGTIYDRWGNVVFGSTSNPFTWNGMRNNESLNPAVFLYSIKVKYVQEGVEREEVLHGDVTIIR